MPKVSILIPTYNYGHFLGEAIQSILDQTFKDFELIVIDDGSTDNTRDVVRNFRDARIRYIYQNHLGISAAQNNGLKASSGEYITGVSADDIYLPKNLELKVKLLDSRPDIGLVCSDAYVFVDGSDASIHRLWHDPKRHDSGFDPNKASQQPLREFLQWGFFIMLQATMLRREVFTRVGYFDESLPTHEDWDFILRVVQHFSILTIDEPLLKLRRHDGNFSINKEKMYQGAVSAINKAMQSYSFSKEERKLLKKGLVLQHTHYGRWALLENRETDARKAFLAAIKVNHWRIRQYIYLVSCFIGSRQLLAIKSLKEKMYHHPSGGQLSSDKEVIENQDYLERLSL